ncbi:hypothetical protein FH972_016962 [Carpinus fangiana]|uniref:WPP domain-containing protein n=1 Tax=Carpinus fangiana TaxID=176857 RepID=A0A5N6RI05_9ROSI|nr:hypothetical protein FH972_016962 [Carpinus fangiana]KAE8098939.1 hypothetical protein FH972_016962 [Carpinus fangiana]
MDLENEYSVLESEEDNEVTQERMARDDDNEIENNGSCFNEIDKLVSPENSNANALRVDTNGDDFESEQPVDSPSLNGNSPGGGSPPMTKGYGLKKWRRIRRDFVKDVSASIDTSKILKRGLSGSTNPTKAQHHFPLEIKQNSESSVGSVNVLTVGVADRFVIHGSSSDSRFAVGSAFAAGTDSENSEDRSSKSSTAASAPKVRYDQPAVLGYVREKSRIKNSGGKSLGNSAQKGQQGKGRTEGSKKHRGERVKIEKENSHSSMESDSRSSNFVFMQGDFTATSNGKQTERSMNYDRENSDEALASEQFSEEVQTGYNKENVGEVEDLSQDDLAADLSWEVKEEKSENHRPSTDRDPLVASIFSLQSVQEALKKEVQKLREIGKEPTSSHDSSTNGNSSPAYFTTTDPENFIPSSSEELGSEKTRQTALTSLETQLLNLTKNVKFLESKLEETGAMVEVKDLRITELEAIINSSKSPKEESGSTIGLQKEKCREMETELEGLFKQKIEAEVEFLAIRRTIENMKVAAGDQFTLLEERNALVLNKIGAAESKAAMLKKESEEEKYSGDMIGTEEVVKMQRRVWKITWCFFIQFIFLVMVFWLFVLQLSPRSGVVVPT